eukprot:m.84640 g.84640  ORF g.84640 m.84640 type:complete len:985 (-) comp8355_c0_seq1:59-3013(-)
MTRPSPLLAVLVVLLAALTAAAPQRLNEHIGAHELLSISTDHLLEPAGARIRRNASPLRTLELRTSQANMTLALEPSLSLFSRRFEALFVRESGVVDMTDTIRRDLHFHGHVLGHSGTSDVRARFHNGTFEASILFMNKLYLLESAARYIANALDSHVFYAADDVTFPVHDNQTTCGVGGDAFDDRSHNHQFSVPKFNTARARRTSGAGGSTSKNTCEMALVADHRFFAANSNSFAATSSAMIAQLEETNRIFKFTDFDDGVGQGIQLAVRRIVVYESAGASGNPFPDPPSSTASSVFLENLGSLIWSDVCLAHGFTTIDFDGGVLGLAFVGTICNVPSPTRSVNVGISTNTNFGSTVPTLQATLVFAHEVGHNFGMNHDTDCSSFCSANPSECSDSSTVSSGGFGNYLMFPTSVDGSEINNNKFSPCSTDSGAATILSNGFCFTNTGGGQICGNGIIEGTEECDCGETSDDSACIAKDPCCAMDCTIRSGRQCSPLAGDCCDELCNFVGFESFETVPNPSDPALHLCRDATECTLAGYCLKDAVHKGKCPDVNFPNHEIYSPSGCFGDPNVANCAQVLPKPGDAEFVGPYEYHKPDLETACNGGANLCRLGTCSASICTQLTATQAEGEVPDGSANPNYVPLECIIPDCEIGCKFVENGNCSALGAYATTDHGQTLNISQTFRAPGRSCQSGRGVCNGGGICIIPNSETPITALLKVDVQAWIWDYWYIVVGLVVGSVAAAFCLRWASSKKQLRVEIRKRMSGVRRSVMQTMRRGGGAAAGVRQANPARRQRKNEIILELHERRKSMALAATQDSAFFRLSTLFPTAAEDTLHRIIECSPHEEAAVSRLLRLGYPMWLFDDYKLLAFAPQRQRALRRQAAATQMKILGKGRGRKEQAEAAMAMAKRGGARVAPGRGQIVNNPAFSAQGTRQAPATRSGNRGGGRGGLAPSRGRGGGRVAPSRGGGQGAAAGDRRNRANISFAF